MKGRTTREKPVYFRMPNGFLQHMLDDNWQPYCRAPFAGDWQSRAEFSPTQMHNRMCKTCRYVHARAAGASKREAMQKAGVVGDGQTKRKTKRTTQIDRAESKRLGRHGKAQTKQFWQRQSFGAASPVRHVDPADYERKEG